MTLIDIPIIVIPGWSGIIRQEVVNKNLVLLEVPNFIIFPPFFTYITSKRLWCKKMNGIKLANVDIEMQTQICILYMYLIYVSLFPDKTSSTFNIHLIAERTNVRIYVMFNKISISAPGNFHLILAWSSYARRKCVAVLWRRRLASRNRISSEMYLQSPGEMAVTTSSTCSLARFLDRKTRCTCCSRVRCTRGVDAAPLVAFQILRGILKPTAHSLFCKTSCSQNIRRPLVQFARPPPPISSSASCAADLHQDDAVARNRVETILGRPFFKVSSLMDFLTYFGNVSRYIKMLDERRNLTDEVKNI